MKKRAVSLAVAFLVILSGCAVMAGLVILLGLPNWINVIAGAVWGALAGPRVYHWFNERR